MNTLNTDEQRSLLLANDLESLQNPDFDPAPVVKLFAPDTGATWLLTCIDPDDHGKPAMSTPIKLRSKPISQQ